MSDLNKHRRWPGLAGSFNAAYVYQDEQGNNLFRKIKCVTRDLECPKYFYFERWEDGRWRGKNGPEEEDSRGRPNRAIPPAQVQRQVHGHALRG